MGIQGLTTFVDLRPELLQRHKLRNCRIVIDGSNFYFFLYSFFGVQLRCGGDYDVYALKIRRVFESLAQCGVQPFVVLDGGDHPDNRKLATQLKRMKDRLRMARQLAHGDRGAVLPVLAFQTFLTVLQDMHIPHAICNFEADDAIAALAARWGCPVMSNDSDFFVYDLKGGLILFDYADLAQPKVDKAGQPFIYVELFQAERFAKYNKIDIETLPLFATLVGNDYVDKATFLDFIKCLPCLKNPGKLSARHALFMRVLNWLKTVENVEAARRYVLARVGESRVHSIQGTLDMSMSHYSDFACADGEELLQYFNEHSSAEKKSPSNQNQSTRKQTPECSAAPEDGMPQWCSEALRVGKLYPFIKNAYLLHRVILLSHVEDFKHPSVNHASAYIRKVIYGILLGSPGKDIHKEQVVMEYDRGGESQNICCMAVGPVWELPGIECLPALAQVPALSKTDRFEVLAAALGVAPAWLTSLPQEMCLMGAVVVYWTQQSKPGVSLLHLQALLVCVLFLHARQELHSRRLAQHQDGTSKEGLAFGSAVDLDEDNEDLEADTFTMGLRSDENNDADVGDEEEEETKTDEIEAEDDEENIAATAYSSDESRNVAHARYEDCADDSTRQHSNASEMKNADSVSPITFEPNSTSSDPTIGNLSLSPLAACQEAKDTDLEGMVQRLDKFCVPPLQTKLHPHPVALIIHVFSELQACLLHATYLSATLQWPVHSPHPQQLLSGTFLYNFLLELQRRPQPQAYLQDVLGSLWNVFSSLQDTILTQIPQGALQTYKSPRAAKRKKKAHSKPLNVPCCSSSEEGEDGAGEGQSVVACSISNRFDLLALDAD